MKITFFFIPYLAYTSDGMYTYKLTFTSRIKVKKKKRMGERKTLNDIYKYSVWVNTAGRILDINRISVWNATSFDDAATPNYRLFRNRIQLCRETYVPRSSKASYQRHSLLFQVLNSQFEKKEGGGKRRRGGDE